MKLARNKIVAAALIAVAMLMALMAMSESAHAAAIGRVSVSKKDSTITVTVTTTRGEYKTGRDIPVKVKITSPNSKLDGNVIGIDSDFIPKEFQGHFAVGGVYNMTLMGEVGEIISGKLNKYPESIYAPLKGKNIYWLYTIGMSTPGYVPSEEQRDADELTWAVTYEVLETPSPFTVKGKNFTVPYKTIKSKDYIVGRTKYLTIKNRKGDLSFRKKSGNSKIGIGSSTGKLRIRKGLKKGKYKVSVTVTDCGSPYYRPKSITRTVTVTVK